MKKVVIIMILFLLNGHDVHIHLDIQWLKEARKSLIGAIRSVLDNQTPNKAYYQYHVIRQAACA